MTMYPGDHARDRYLRLMTWARRRYQASDGSLVLTIGGEPQAYLRIERAAFRRYFGGR